MAKNKNPFWTPWPLPQKFKTRGVIERGEFSRGATLHLCCTQLNDTQSEKKRILNEWIDFLNSGPKLSTLRIGTRCPQELFEAACQCSSLTSLEIHWGPIADLKPIRKLTKLKRLGFGSCSVSDLAPLKKLAELEHLSLGNFDRLEDYSAISSLKRLKQLLIEGAPMMPKSVWIDNIRFLKKLTALHSLSLTAVKFRDETFFHVFKHLDLKWLDLWVDDDEIRQSILQNLPKLKGGRILE